MKGSRLVQDYLRDILDAMEKAEEFVGGLEVDSFKQDDKTAYAVIRSLEIIGEASKKIPGVMRRRFSKIPWKSLAGMRDKLIHDYIGVSLEIVWRTAKEDIPTVRPLLIEMLRQVEAEEGTVGNLNLPSS
ncbi:DUF86 domain-containing protein [Desulfuromonas sp. CSMB_57]|uniref:HepT-like ribonuclease domain-containing protein n=1 Tax=Desulfuromonas sp. CSMB_57 TaxID=2807629 RepID=UPI001CD1BDB4|nr:DUF86 domain-containing protein [Desulfuromonas sp. CSMB_57]